jgi:hypothetical protein
MPWEPEDEPGWQVVMLRKMPPSIDETLLAEALKLTPMQRFEQWKKLMQRARKAQAMGAAHASRARR